ncbi:siphovirus Gp157 family protein [Agrobacterium radiobacter]|uniref:siphovirus Gp157 family protein n=1 Tax=Agrobacterium radiobacter TaxID=362 RepID=UPI0034132945
MLPPDRKLMRETEAAKKLISDLPPDDDQLVADSIEGETGLLEAIDAALSEIDECEILIVGIDEKIKVLETRKKQQKDRADRIRTLIERAMLETEQFSLRLPTGTITLRKVSPALVINNEADIPARFWVEQERPAPKLDKKSLAEAIKSEIIPGASLDNGTVSLSIRRR